MLKRLELRNFQAHAKTAIDLDPRITTIRGPTDTGKSAVLRALRWVALNDIAGDAFVREGEREAVVTLRVGEHKIIRTRGSSNTYELDDAEFKAFGQGGVPPAIAELLNLSEINFQGQHDSPFWFAETAGEVSRQLNAIIDLSIIDTALANIAARVREATERKNVTAERLKELQNELEEKEPQRARIEMFAALKQRRERWQEHEQNCNRLENIIDRIRSNQAEVLAEKAQGLEKLLGDGRLVVQLRRKAAALDELIDDIAEKREQAKAPPNFSQVRVSWEARGEAIEAEDNLSALIDQIFRVQATKNDKLDALETAEKRFHQKTKGQKCPLCGNQIQ